MRICLLIVFLLLPASAAAQEGVISYSGQQTIEVSREFLLASIPESMRADTAMIEMLLADLPEEGISMPMNWIARYSGQTVLGGMDMAQLVPELGPAPPAMTPFTGSPRNLGGSNSESFIDYENRVVISSVPSFMEEPYVITSELDSTMKMDWVLGNRDSTVLGYGVRQATTELSPEQIESVMGQMSGIMPSADQAPPVESAVITAWYASELPGPAGPMSMSGLPGAILHLVGRLSMAGTQVVMEFSADSIETTLDRPVQPPSGMPISQEDYLELMRVRMEAMQKQILDAQ